MEDIRQYEFGGLNGNIWSLQSLSYSQLLFKNMLNLAEDPDHDA